jgi:hypothetical protein
VSPATVRGPSSGEGRREGLAGEDGLEGGEQRLALLAQRRQVASEAGERIGSRVAAEAARDFLLDLEPAQGTLGLVVLEGDGEIVQEGEHPLPVQHEALEQGARRRLGQAAPLPWPAS